MSPTPAIGRTVLVLVDPKFNSGSDVAPAVITHVWSEDLVNVRVTHDGPSVAPEGRNDWLTSLTLHGSRKELEDHCAAKREEFGHNGSDWGAFWPPHV